jgi:hypothetical protein
MNTVETKGVVIRTLLDSVAAAFGPDAFPLETQQPDSPEQVILTSARDRRFSASFIAVPERPGHFSVMVEIYDPSHSQLVPFEIVVDGEFSLPEVLELLGRYRE